MVGSSAVRGIGAWHILLVICASTNRVAYCQTDAASHASADPLTTIERYEQTLVPYKCFRGIWTNKDYDSKQGELPSLRETQKWTVFRDHDRARLVSEQLNAKTNSKKVYEDVSIEGKQWLSVYPDGAVMSKLQVSPQDHIDRLGMAPASECYGMILKIWIPAFMRASKLSVQDDTIEGQPVLAVHGVSKDPNWIQGSFPSASSDATSEIEITVWLDPAMKYVLRRARLEKRGSQSHSIDFDAQKFRQQAGEFVATKATVTIWNSTQPVMRSTATSIDGKGTIEQLPATDDNGNVIYAPETRFLRDIELVTLDFNPKFADGDFALSTPIASGTKVNMQDALHLTYVWQDGKAVPAMDPNALAQLRAARFLGGSSSPRFWMVVFTLMVILILLAVKFRQWRLSRPGV